MFLEPLRIAIAVILTGTAAYQDSKTSYVSDWILYSMIAAGLLLNAATMDAGFFLSTLPVAIVIAAAGFVMWKRGSLGQGDVWLFLGLQFLLPEFPSFSQIALPGFPFVASVFLAASFFSVFGSSVFYAWLLAKKKGLEKTKVVVFAGVSIVAAFFFFTSFLSPSAKAFFAFFSIAALFLALFFNDIKEKILVQWVPLSQVEDEDVLVLERIPSQVARKYSLGRVATAGIMAKLKKIVKSGRMKKFPVYKNLIRFHPYVFLGLLACLYVGDVLLWVLFN
ncbi:MAG: A24 family peptidase [Candidatus Micrarchaeota archaeon]